MPKIEREPCQSLKKQSQTDMTISKEDLLTCPLA